MGTHTRTPISWPAGFSWGRWVIVQHNPCVAVSLPTPDVLRTCREVDEFTEAGRGIVMGAGGGSLGRLSPLRRPALPTPLSGHRARRRACASARAMRTRRGSGARAVQTPLQSRGLGGMRAPDDTDPPHLGALQQTPTPRPQRAAVPARNSPAAAAAMAPDPAPGRRCRGKARAGSGDGGRLHLFLPGPSAGPRRLPLLHRPCHCYGKAPHPPAPADDGSLPNKEEAAAALLQLSEENPSRR